MTDDEKPRPEMEDAPPLLGSWRNIYLTVIGTLALYVAMLWMFSRFFS